MFQMFFILRKKDNQISFLHCYHHSTVLVTTYAVCVFYPGGHCKYIPQRVYPQGIFTTFCYSFHCAIGKQFCSCYYVHVLFPLCTGTSCTEIFMVEEIFDSTTIGKKLIQTFIFIEYVHPSTGNTATQFRFYITDFMFSVRGSEKTSQYFYR